MGLEVITLASIRENPVALRSVNRESEEYKGLVDSIKNVGFMGTITVRKKNDPETKVEFYELVDGLHRFCAAADAGLKQINVDCVNLSDDSVMEAQIMANIHKVETRPIEYSKQLLRILSRNPLMTEAELAAKLGKSPQWISERLNLTRITNPKIMGLVNEGKIKLANAYALAKLPAEEMADFVDRAMTKQPDEFVPEVQARVKEIREAKRKGDDAPPAEFVPVQYCQKLKDIKGEIEAGSVRAILRGLAPNSFDAGFEMALKWILHVDPKSSATQKTEDEQRRTERTEARQKREGEKAVKRAEKAKEKAIEAAKAADEAAKAANAVK